MNPAIDILHVCYSDHIGGAAIAAYRQHCAMLESGVNSRMLVVKKVTTDRTVLSVGRFSFYYIKVINRLVQLAFRLIGSDVSRYRSLNLFPTGVGRKIEKIRAGTVRFHWPHGEMISVFEISRIEGHVEWFAHDMWPLLGFEHYDLYQKRGIDNPFENVVLNFAEVKYQQYKKKRLSGLSFLAPSNWLRDEIKMSYSQSDLERNVLNKEIFKEDDLSKFHYKDADTDVVVLFGAENTRDLRKGGDLLIESMNRLAEDVRVRIVIVVFGAGEEISMNLPNFRVRKLGVIDSEVILAKVYRSCDVFIAPSRQDNYPNTVLEATSCGLPIIAFDIGGMPDLVPMSPRSILLPNISSGSLSAAIAAFVSRII